jgi:hypothetical protein
MHLAQALQENPLFELIARSAAQQGVEAYVIGGFVRDLLLKRPSKDIDIVCVGSGIDLARRVAQTAAARGSGRVPELRHGHAAARRLGSGIRGSPPGVVPAGFAQAHRGGRHAGRRPEPPRLYHQRPGDQPAKRNFGELIDPFGGLRDLDKKIIRTPLDPEITFPTTRCA